VIARGLYARCGSARLAPECRMSDNSGLKRSHREDAVLLLIRSFAQHGTAPFLLRVSETRPCQAQVRTSPLGSSSACLLNGQCQVGAMCQSSLGTDHTYVVAALVLLDSSWTRLVAGVVFADCANPALARNGKNRQTAATHCPSAWISLKFLRVQARDRLAQRE
jgi:hypothetical protein